MLFPKLPFDALLFLCKLICIVMRQLNGTFNKLYFAVYAKPSTGSKETALFAPWPDKSKSGYQTVVGM